MNTPHRTGHEESRNMPKGFNKILHLCLQISLKLDIYSVFENYPKCICELYPHVNRLQYNLTMRKAGTCRLVSKTFYKFVSLKLEIEIRDIQRVWCIIFENARKCICELYPTVNRLQYNLTKVFLYQIPSIIQNFIGINHTYRTWCTKYWKSAENVYGSYIYII